ncbi:hypothetical protein MY11210_002420 [Beauveria gryllotalpidicola]
MPRRLRPLQSRSPRHRPRLPFSDALSNLPRRALSDLDLYALGLPSFGLSFRLNLESVSASSLASSSPERVSDRARCFGPLDFLPMELANPDALNFRITEDADTLINCSDRDRIDMPGKGSA